MVDIYNVGDNCRAASGRAARSVGFGWALVRTGEDLLLSPMRVACGGEAVEELPTDLDVARVHLSLISEGYDNVRRP